MLSQVCFKEEREFPERVGELASKEHGHERAADAADEFVGVLTISTISRLTS
jgi:hypothetical protein